MVPYPRIHPPTDTDSSPRPALDHHADSYRYDYRAAKRPIRGAGGSEAHWTPEHIPAEPGTSDSNAVIPRAERSAPSIARTGPRRIRPATWTAFWRTAVEGDRPADVAADLNVSVWAVYKSRGRASQRLRQPAQRIAVVLRQGARSTVADGGAVDSRRPARRAVPR